MIRLFTITDKASIQFEKFSGFLEEQYLFYGSNKWQPLHHRAGDKLPSRYHDYNEEIVIEYRKNGHRHRLGGPALICEDSEAIRYYWFENGICVKQFVRKI